MKTTRRILPLFFILSISEHVLLWRYMLCWNGEIYVNFMFIAYVYNMWCMFCGVCCAFCVLLVCAVV